MPTLFLPCLYRHHTYCHASLLPSSSTALTTIHIFFVVLIIPPLYCLSIHIRRVSALYCLPRLCSPRATVYFFPIISSLMIVHTFRFSEMRMPSPVSAITFFLFAPLFFVSLCGNRQTMLPTVQSRVRSDGVVCHLQPFVSTTVRYASYCSIRPTSSSLCHPIISASLCRPSPPLVALHLCRVSTVFILPEYLLPTVPVVFVVH